MQKRKLGNSGLEIGPLVLGTNVFGWTVKQDMASKLLNRYLESGNNLIDTADVYFEWAPGNKGGESETIIGNWLKQRGRRSDVLIATKVGWETSDGKKGLKKDYILRSAEESLRRLQTDYIDLYQSHCEDLETRPQETLEAYGQLIKSGKVRAIGASNFAAQTLGAALKASAEKGLPRYESLQPRYNLYERDEYEGALEEVCAKNNVGVIPYTPLAAGFLTGKYRSKKDLENRARGETVKQYMTDRGFRILKALDDIAAQYNATPTQIALAWTLTRPSITAPIASATTVEQLEELIGATRVKLDSSAMRSLDQASAYQKATA